MKHFFQWFYQKIETFIIAGIIGLLKYWISEHFIRCNFLINNFLSNQETAVRNRWKLFEKRLKRFMLVWYPYEFEGNQAPALAIFLIFERSLIWSIFRGWKKNRLQCKLFIFSLVNMYNVLKFFLIFFCFLSFDSMIDFKLL